MPHVVAEPCIECTSHDCTEVCPVDCFVDAGTMLVIDPEICIDCQACVPVCPADAIFHQDSLPVYWKPFRDLNATLARQRVRIRRQPEFNN